MNILLIGSGGREHAIAQKLGQSQKLDQLFIAPGNTGTAQYGTNVPIKETQLKDLLNFAKEANIHLTIVGPEAPLVEGIVDLFEANKLAIVGPNQKGAQLEGSKNWAKAFMKKHHIPTAEYQTFTDYDQATQYIQNKNTYPIVIKADGLAAGKGVTVAQNKEDALDALKACLIDHKFAKAGAKVVIEDFLEGEESSVFALSDGKTIIPLIPAQDHKAIYDNDKGPNTGGMGAYAPAPLVNKDIQDQISREILIPTLKGLQAEGITYKGILFAGLMIHNNKAKVIEFNVRFGDPETQAVLALLENDLADIFEAIATQTLDQHTLKWKPGYAITIVLASKGYPGDYEKGKIITGLNTPPLPNTHVIHAGTQINEAKQITTNGGRVLNIVSTAPTLQEAITTAYQQLENIQFEGKTYRNDIGKKGLNYIKS